MQKSELKKILRSKSNFIAFFQKNRKYFIIFSFYCYPELQNNEHVIRQQILPGKKKVS